MSYISMPMPKNVYASLTKVFPDALFVWMTNMNNSVLNDKTETISIHFASFAQSSAVQMELYQITLHDQNNRLPCNLRL